MNSDNQLLINFDFKKDYSNQDFYVTKSNSDAYNLINNWPKWIKRTVNLYGEKYSGKTHLSKIFQEKTSCISIKSEEFSNDTLTKFKTKQAIIIEDYSQNISENLLYSLINAVEQENKYLLITSLISINRFKFKLNDLISRINNTLYIELQKPDDELIYALIVKNFSDRQISIDKKIIDYIIRRINRSYKDIFMFIYNVDQMSLKRGKPINLSIIKKILE
jgi:chromosomal replication initiation ATPase DnaA|tara:strand:- start:438 stop:1097 length:660 start_codon:yes stop_codon:yes gene_type:complete